MKERYIRTTSLVLAIVILLHFSVPGITSAASVEEGSEEAIDNLVKLTVEAFINERPSKIKTVAVWQITNDSEAKVNVKDVKDLVDIELISAGFDVTDRSKLDLIIREQQLGQTGAVEESKLQQIGKLYGIDAFIYGRISRVDPGPPVIITFFVKAIDVETGKFIFAKRIRGKEVAEEGDIKEETPAPIEKEGKEEPKPKEEPRVSNIPEKEFDDLKIEIFGDDRFRHNRVTYDEEGIASVILNSKYSSRQTRSIVRDYQSMKDISLVVCIGGFFVIGFFSLIPWFFIDRDAKNILSGAIESYNSDLREYLDKQKSV